ncbi:hypothetical protein [uncultured Duncaniella sp.]|uniref:hypothetical protein n=1 Tax=uncultured Duncaniella sp. TaxID=2768039 RepID=UPI0025B64F15|nr:hypothetical protein [uncultured Duncaniella sp.]
MGKHFSDSLYSPCCHIMSSDEDQPIVMDIYVGFNISSQLVVCVDLHDYDEPEYNCSTAAVVHLDDSHKMAHLHRVKHSRLPIFIAECMEEWAYIINPTFTQVRDCFKEITECLLDEGCRFRIKRTYGKGNHMCC